MVWPFAANPNAGYFTINFVWVLVVGALAIFTQIGFALVEAGLVRAKNAAHTASMNVAVYGFAMLGFFVSGFALLSGGYAGTGLGGALTRGALPNLDGMITLGAPLQGDHGWGLFGTHGFFIVGSSLGAPTIATFLFAMAFVATTATLVTGACAERWSYRSFLLFSIVIGGFLFPMFACWVWGGGWLAQLGYRWGLGHGAVDYAGLTVVHLQGGALAFVASRLIGPRIGRFDANGKVHPIPPHHVPIVKLGTIVLALAWFGFSVGTSLASNDGRIRVVATSSIVAAITAALSAVASAWVLRSRFEAAMARNGMIAGLVAITSPAAFVGPGSAFVIGAVAGALAVCGVRFVEKMRIDDPVDVISVHGLCGLWGTLAVGLFADGTYGAGWNGVASNVTGLFYGDPRQLVAQVITASAAIAWNVIAGGAVFYAIGKLLGSNRVPAEVEVAGLDVIEVASTPSSSPAE